MIVGLPYAQPHQFDSLFCFFTSSTYLSNSLPSHDLRTVRLLLDSKDGTPSYKYRYCASYCVTSAILDVITINTACPIKLFFEDRLLGTTKCVTISPEERRVSHESCEFNEEVFGAMGRWQEKGGRPAMEIVYRRGGGEQEEDLLQMALFPSLLWCELLMCKKNEEI